MVLFVCYRRNSTRPFTNYSYVTVRIALSYSYVTVRIALSYFYVTVRIATAFFFWLISLPSLLPFLFPFAIDSVIFSVSKMLLCPSSYPFAFSNQCTWQHSDRHIRRHIVSVTLTIQRTYMAIQENFVTFFPRH